MGMNQEADSVHWMSGDDTLAAQIRGEQVRRLYGNTTATTLAAAAMAIGLTWGVSHHLATDSVWLWLVLKLLVILPRFWQVARFHQAADQDDPRWYHAYMALLVADGVVWGLAGLWLLPPDRLDVAAIVVAALIGLSAAGAFVLHPVWMAALGFVLPLLTPTAIKMLGRGDAVGLFAGLGIIGFAGVMLGESRRAEQRLVELLGLRFSTDRIARERAEALVQAQQHSAVKSQFLATMSHEMRTPLHGILGLTRLVRQTERDPESRRRLELVERSGEHLLTVINDILDFSKIEAGHLKIEHHVFDLAVAVDDVAALCTVQAQDKGLALGIASDLPRPCFVEGDAARFRQVLWNLLGNAVKFTERGKVSVQVRRSEGGLVAVTVQDTGIGIAPTEMARIFEPFLQVDGSFGRRYAGTGLGLAISRELSRAMGGDIVCSSRPGEGSTFIFTARMLPAADPHAPVRAADRSWLPPTARVLVAEDNQVNALVAEATLQRLGMDVEIVENGEAAVQRMREHPRPDLLLMDCQMPVMDGFEATRRIRAEEASAGLPPVPIVALTANALEGDRQRCLDAGMDDHLPKPFSEEGLAQVIRACLGPRGNVRQSM